MNLSVLKQSESPLAALWQTPILPQCVFFLSSRRPLSVSSVCHKVQMAEWCSDARLSGGLAGHHSGSQPEGSCSLLLLCSVTQFDQTISSAGGPSASKPSDSRRVLVLPKLCPPSTKLWSRVYNKDPRSVPPHRLGL